MPDKDNAFLEPATERLIPFRNYIPEPDELATSPDRLRLSSDTLFPVICDQREALDTFRNHMLMDESSFVNWARKRGVEVSGIISETDIDLFWKRGWIRVDEVMSVSRSWRQRATEIPVQVDLNRGLGINPPALGRWRRHGYQLHPFRMYPLLKLLQSMEWRLIHSNVLYGPGVMAHAKHHVQQFRQWMRNPQFMERLRWWNGVADLAILLEPIYWPTVVTGVKGTQSVIEDDEFGLWRQYRQTVLELLAKIPKASIALAHMNLRHDAGHLDDNSELYLVLRSMTWERREKIVGHLGGSLWLRHMAEVLRHGFDELYADRLVHEDEDFGFWHEGAREWVYGSEYPLDNIPDMVRRILPKWGINTAVRVKFYVEGATEQGALEAALQGFLGLGIEIVNLRAQGWDTWLRSELENDKRAKRLSILMLDADREDDIRAIRAHARDGLIVGLVFVNRPDFEFGCFSKGQLLEAIRHFEELLGREGLEPLPESFLEGVNSGKELEEAYCKARVAPGLKGKPWGESLARAAFESNSPGDETNRLVFAVACARRSLRINYEVQSTSYKVDPDSLESVPTGIAVMQGAKAPSA